VHGGNTKITANIFVKDGKIKIKAGNRDRGDGDDDCDGEKRDKDEYNSDTTFMTGWFIAESVESDGNKVIWSKNGCTIPSSRADAGQPVIASRESGELLEIKVLPNPTTDNFRLLVQTYSKELLQIRITDASGRVLENYSNVSPYSVIKIGDKFISGVYFAQVIQGKQSKVVKLVKAK